MRLLCSLIVSLALSGLSYGWGFERCESFALHITSPAVDVLVQEFYHANDLVNVTNPFSAVNTTSLPAFCRLLLQIMTNATAGSSAQTEVWLPEQWTGRYLVIGNGGYAGGATIEDMAYIGMVQGFASVSTDTGHVSGASNASWALGNDNAIIDWSWRALKLSIDVGKEVVRQYYNETHHKSYYLGCSTGGRQGLLEAQRFPTDFDGILIGSPSNQESHLQAWGLHTGNLIQPNTSANWISNYTWAGLIHDEVLRQCDGLDGVEDGILNDPTKCNFDTSPITCPANSTDTSECLTPLQAAAVTQVFANYTLADGTFIFDGYYPGGEAMYATAGYIGSAPNVYAIDWERFFIYNESTWNASSFTEDTIRLSDELDTGRTNAIETDLFAYAGPAHGGKIVHYVGLADHLISPGWSKRYHAQVAETMQTEHGVEVDEFYRLFTVPGMQHCRGGSGTNAFGGSRQASLKMPPLSHDPENDILQALVAWVERGRAPTQLVGAYYNNNTVEDGIGFVRPICMYPKGLMYVGGNPNVSASFECA